MWMWILCEKFYTKFDTKLVQLWHERYSYTVEYNMPPESLDFPQRQADVMP